jgi:hypothetical protein
VTARVHNLTVDDLHTYYVRTAVADGHIPGTQSHTNRIKPNPSGKVKSTSIWGGERWARIHTRLTWTFGRQSGVNERIRGFPWRTDTMNGRA